MRRFIALITFLSLACPAAVAVDPATAEDHLVQAVDFAHQILPLLKARCSKCHTAGTYKGDLSMDTRATLIKSKAIVPGDAAKSELIKRISSNDAEERMPPKGEP